MWLKSNPSQNFLNCGQSDSGWHSFSIDNLSSKFEMWANNIFSHYHLLLIKFFQCKKTALSYREIEILFFKSCQHLIVVSSLGRNTKILNFEHSKHWMSEHRTFRTSHFGPKLNFEHVEHHKKPNSSRTSNCMFQD